MELLKISRDFTGSLGLTKVRDNWRAFWRLTAYERAIVVEAAAGLLATWIGLRVFNFRRWKKFLDIFVPPELRDSSAGTIPPIAAAQTIAQLEISAARHLFFRTNCLEQSMVLWWLLRRRQIPAELRIGARKQEGQFEAHAWVEYAGAMVADLGVDHLHFSPFDGPVAPLETPKP